MSDTEDIVRDIFGDSDESDDEFEVRFNGIYILYNIISYFNQFDIQGFDGGNVVTPTEEGDTSKNENKDDDNLSKSSESEAEGQPREGTQEEKAKEAIPEISESDDSEDEINRDTEKSQVYIKFDLANNHFIDRCFYFCFIVGWCTILTLCFSDGKK